MNDETRDEEGHERMERGKKGREKEEERAREERIERCANTHPVAFKGPFGVLSAGADPDALRWAVLSLADHWRYAGRGRA